MTIVVAALDATAVARTVLETALRVGDLMGVKVEAVNVRDGAPDAPRSLADRANVPLRLLEGPEGPALVAVLSKPVVRAGVIGARSAPGGSQPVGHTAQHVLSHTQNAVVVVPPEAFDPPPLRRILVPLEGGKLSDARMVEYLDSLFGPSAKLIVLHVFTLDTLPAMIDRPAYDFEILGDEFLARHLPGANHVEFRPGPAGRRVLEVCRETGVDLVVLSWEQDLSNGRARVVKEVLQSSLIPVVLVPETRINKESEVDVQVPEPLVPSSSASPRGVLMKGVLHATAMWMKGGA